VVGVLLCEAVGWCICPVEVVEMFRSVCMVIFFSFWIALNLEFAA
jgi:hypothetical protein